MKKYQLKAQKRSLFGRKVKSLRRSGILPVNVYGKHVKSEAAELQVDEFMQVYSQAGETGVIEFAIDGKVRPVLVHNVQLHPVTQAPLHVDLRQVDLKEKVKAKVPLTVIGESSAVTQKLGVLLELLHEVEVEALPTDIPESIEVDVSKLTQVGETLKVVDLKIPSGVLVLTTKDVEVAKIDELVSKEAEALAKEEAAAQAEAQAQEGAPEEVGKEVGTQKSVEVEDEAGAAFGEKETTDKKTQPKETAVKK